MKTTFLSNLSLYPCPVVLVTSKHKQKENVLTVSWAGIASSNPEYITIAINPKRFSYLMILESEEFGINIPVAGNVEAIDFCGSHSGKNVDKFEICGFSKFYGHYIQAPLIEECPVNFECKVYNHIDLGSHVLFVARIVNKYIDDEIKMEDIHEKLNPLIYFRPNYYSLKTEKLGYYGFTKNILPDDKLFLK